jgi:hypothetical protein
MKNLEKLKKIIHQYEYPIKTFEYFILIVITLSLCLPYISLIDTYSHEKAHVKAFQKYGVNTSYEPNVLKQIPNFYNNFKRGPHFVGLTKLASEEDIKNYKNLPNEALLEINLSGILSDLWHIIYLFFILMMVNIVYFIIPPKYIKKKKMRHIIILFIWFFNALLVSAGIVLILSTIQNLSVVSGLNSDLKILLAYWKCI